MYPEAQDDIKILFGIVFVTEDLIFDFILCKSFKNLYVGNQIDFLRRVSYIKGEIRTSWDLGGLFSCWVSLTKSFFPFCPLFLRLKNQNVHNGIIVIAKY